MIHNKFQCIVEQYLGNYSRQIYGRQLVGKVPLSQKNIALTLERLQNGGVLKSQKSGNMKYFCLNKEYYLAKDILALAEIGRKLAFFEKHKKLADLFKDDDRILGVFGSYAAGTERTDSDVDLFIIGDKIADDYLHVGEIFDVKFDIKRYKLAEFANLLRRKNTLCCEIASNHVVILVQL